MPVANHLYQYGLEFLLDSLKSHWKVQRMKSSEFHVAWSREKRKEENKFNLGMSAK